MRRVNVVAIAWMLAVGSALGATDFGAILERYQGAVVPVRYTQRPQEPTPGADGRKQERVLCGVIVSDDGLVITSGDAFPLPGGDPRTTLEPVEFVVLGPDETEFPLAALGLNRDLNLAYLRFEGGLPEGYRSVHFDRDRSIQVGEEIVILGLLPSRYDYARTFWTGRISAAIEQPRSMFALTAFVQDLSIGGLAVNPDGKPLGLIAEDVLPPAGRGQDVPGNPLSILGSLSQGPLIGYPMLFPPALFEQDLASPPPFEREPSRSWFGITMQPLSRGLGDYWKISNPGGIVVTSVLEGSPAESARIRPGDVILQVGETIVTARETPDLVTFRQVVEKLPRGEPVRLDVWREGQPIELTIHPGIAPRTGFQARDYRDEDFGLTVRELTLDVIQGQNLPPDAEGVVIAEMESSGWAMVAGLQIGDIVLRVNDRVTPVLDSFQEALDQAREAKAPETYFFVERGVETMFVTVRTDW